MCGDIVRQPPGGPGTSAQPDWIGGGSESRQMMHTDSGGSIQAAVPALVASPQWAISQGDGQVARESSTTSAG